MRSARLTMVLRRGSSRKDQTNAERHLVSEYYSESRMRLHPQLPSMILTTAVLLATTCPALAQRGSAGADWRYISGDPGGTKYSPLDQINAANVSQLKIA